MNIQIAANILHRAIELDNKARYTEAFICYQEGLQVLVDSLKGETGEQRSTLRCKIENYMKRAEEIKGLIEKSKNEGTFHEQTHIENDSTGHSYENVFGRFLDGDIVHVKIEDPYIRAYHQCQNLVRLCELLIKKCKKLKAVELLTTSNGAEQGKWLNDLKHSLDEHNVQLNVLYSETLHDRQISLNTGWIIKIGRGLDYFKAPPSKFSLGIFDLDLRQCHETTVDIYHSKSIKSS